MPVTLESAIRATLDTYTPEERQELDKAIINMTNVYKDLRLPAKQAFQGSEDALQSDCAEWLKKKLLVENIPQELHWHTPSEGIRKPQYRAKLKRMGFRSGIPDTTLALPSQEYHGLYCELKKAGNGPSKTQKTMLAALTAQGYLAVVINDFETFKDVFSYYIDNRTNK